MNGKLIVVVDDSEEDQILFKTAFNAAGFPVRLLFFNNAHDATHFLSDEKHELPTLIALDLKMPAMDGLQILEWIRRQERLRVLVVTMLTSSGNSNDVRRAYELGANSYLIKPVSFTGYQELARKLWEYWIEANRSPEGSATY